MESEQARCSLSLIESHLEAIREMLSVLPEIKSLLMRKEERESTLIQVVATPDLPSDIDIECERLAAEFERKRLSCLHEFDMDNRRCRKCGITKRDFFANG